jgi:hypothetical protein
MNPLRLLASAAIATVIVLALMVSVLWAFGLFEREAEEVVYVHPVDMLSQSDRVDVAELVGGRERQLPRRPPPRAIEPMEVPPREVAGFVQLEVEVDAHGRVQRADVVNALPAGVYEQQAVRQVRQRRYPPSEGGATYVEVVPFRVAVDEVPLQDD